MFKVSKSFSDRHRRRFWLSTHFSRAMHLLVHEKRFSFYSNEPCVFQFQLNFLSFELHVRLTPTPPLSHYIATEKQKPEPFREWFRREILLRFFLLDLMTLFRSRLGSLVAIRARCCCYFIVIISSMINWCVRFQISLLLFTIFPSIIRERIPLFFDFIQSKQRNSTLSGVVYVLMMFLLLFLT